MELKIKALSPKIGTEIPLPKFATAGAACMDLCACIDAPVTLEAGARALIPTGIAIALPSADYVALVFARSGLGIKQGVCLSNGVGVIDSDYRGEIGVGLVNLGQERLYGAARRPHCPADGDAGGAAHGGAGVGAGRHRPGRGRLRLDGTVTDMAKIVLASGSPRRQELLRRIGVAEFDVRVPEVEEYFPPD